MISRQQLEIINRRTLRYPLHIAEKDYFLALALKKIIESPLGRILVFKGGTALHHCYLEQYRFSEDLDFSSNQNPVTLEKVRAVFNDGDYWNIKKDYSSGATVKLEKLQYTGPLGQPNSLKVEIDFLQNTLLPSKKMPYHNAWGLNFEVQIMDIKEICAEKIRATSSRARYRDFYDLFLLLEKYPLNLKEIVGYIREKEIRNPISKASILENWSVVGTQKAKEMTQIYYSCPVDDSKIQSLINDIPLSVIHKLNMDKNGYI